jgi:hypothetical protein
MFLYVLLLCQCWLYWHDRVYLLLLLFTFCHFSVHCWEVTELMNSIFVSIAVYSGWFWLALLKEGFYASPDPSSRCGTVCWRRDRTNRVNGMLVPDLPVEDTSCVWPMYVIFLICGRASRVCCVNDRVPGKRSTRRFCGIREGNIMRNWVRRRTTGERSRLVNETDMWDP